MSIAFNFFRTLLFTTPNAVVLSIWIGVGGCLCPISSSNCRCGMASCELIKSAASSASAADDITARMICEVVCIAPLFVGNSSFSDKKKWPPARLRAFVSERYDASLCAVSTMLLALYVTIASGFDMA